MNLLELKNQKDREKRNKELSKERLTKFCESKIKTTMIGAINAIEKELGDDLDDPKLKEHFRRIRESILDQGNNQIRSLQGEMGNYEVEYFYNIPLKVRNV